MKKKFGLDNNWMLGLIIAACFFMTAGCQETAQDQVKETGVPENNIVEQDSASAFEKGYQILFNAKNRFEYPQAVELLEQAVSADSSNVQAQLYLIYAYNKRGQYDDALEYIPAIRSRIDELSPKERLWFEALAGRIEDDVVREISFWEEATNAFPDDRWAWYELSSAYQGLEQYAESAQAAAKALEIESSSEKWEASWIYYLYSKGLYRSGQYSKAGAVDVSAENTPTTWRSTFFRIGLGKLASGESDDKEGAVKEYREISEKEGRNNTSYTEANVALFFFELGDFQNAVKHAQVAYDLDPKAYQAWTLGYSLIENGQAAEGLEVMEKAVQEFPDDASSLAAKGWALYRLGRFEEARDSLIAAQNASPRNNAQINNQLEIVEAAIANPDQAQAPAISWLG